MAAVDTFFLFEEYQIHLQRSGSTATPSFRIKVAGKTIDPDDLSNVVALTGLFFYIAALGSILLSFMGPDLTTAVSASVASLFNIGPGLGQVGAMGNYAEIPALGKGIIISYMLMGRLEIFGILLLFLPMTWRK